LFLKRERRLEVDLGELGYEKEFLSSFLRSELKVDVALKGNKVLVDSENLTSKELKRMVNKFVYRRNLMREYWVALEDDVVKISKFKRSKKHKKPKKGIPPSIIRHGW